MAATRRGVLGAVAGVGAWSLSGAARAQGTATQGTGGGKAGRVIRIGVLSDMSGVYRDISGPISLACVQQAIADFDPGAHGLSVEVLSGDHQNKPDVGASLVRQWFDRDHVDMVIDVPNSAVALAVAGVCREKDRVFIDSGAGTADLTGSQCAATTVHWTYDTWQLAHSTGGALVAQGGKSWFFITADYAFGQALERDTTAFVKGAGGTVLGSVRAPLSTSDFSSYLLQAQSSGAQVVGLCNAGTDMSNAVKQAAEFGLTQNGTKLAALLCFISDVQALGLPAAKGLVLTSTFYWDLNDRTRAFSARLQPRIGTARAGMGQAGCYAGMLHYLKAVAALGAPAGGAATVARMKAMPTDDDAFGPGSIRADGRALHPSYLFQVKTPAQSKGPWDDYTLLATTPAAQAWRPLDQGGCKLVTG